MPRIFPPTGRTLQSECGVPALFRQLQSRLAKSLLAKCRIACIELHANQIDESAECEIADQREDSRAQGSPH